MSKTVRGLLALSVLVVVAGCNRAPAIEEYVSPAPTTITAEPVFTGKYN